METSARRHELAVVLAGPGAAVKRLRLHWKDALPEGWKYLGDAWERGYGDLGWRSLDGGRVMPWYFLATDGKTTHGYGVKTGPGALCHWTAEATGVTLDADVRCGGTGVRLGCRKLDVMTVVARRGEPGEAPFTAAREFCRMMCPKARLPVGPVYGFNNWYCNYGRDTAGAFLDNAEYLAGLAPADAIRPFAVVDAGWQGGADTAKDAAVPAGWDRANPAFSPGASMADIARRIRDMKARPGLWCRPLIAGLGHPPEWRLPRDHAYLDPSVPAVRVYVRDMISRFKKWGYELIKHDFSTWDITGRWGFEMAGDMTGDGWAFADRGLTTAEVIRDLYRDIRKAAGPDTLIIGCNTVGHLAAGLVEIQRIGDDTSGEDWSRTRKMGVNSLAFRAPQHGTFFAIDGDCVGQTATDSVPWEKNRQWLDLLARSGTPLFVSFKKDTVSPFQEEALRAAFSAASGELATGEPVDWLDNPTPTRWMLEGKEKTFDW